MTITFESETQRASFYSPLADFERTTVEVEIRVDPMTGRHSRIVTENFLLPAEEPDIESVVENAEGCFFCPDSVGDVTPTYDDFVGVDRGHVGEATSFPNLHPYGAHSNVVVLTEDHYRPLDAFTPEILTDGYRAALEYIGVVFEADESARYASINMNFLRPAGSSIVHPHMQTLIDDRGTTVHRDFVAATEDETATSWADLLEAIPDSRRITTRDDWTWYAPFAPKHHFHVRGVAPRDGIPDPDDTLLEPLGSGMANVLSFYADRGLNSFNMATYLGPPESSLPVVVDIVGRSVFDSYYWSDSPFFAVLHDESVVDEAPEEYGPAVAEFF